MNQVLASSLSFSLPAPQCTHSSAPTLLLHYTTLSWIPRIIPPPITTPAPMNARARWISATRVTAIIIDICAGICSGCVPARPTKYFCQTSSCLC